MIKHNCIIVADSSRARFFEANSDPDSWVEVSALGHPESRSTNRDLSSDRPGRSFSSFGGSRHAMANRTDPREHEAEVFAREVVEHLKKQEPLASCNKIALIAPPQFLGLLRKNLDRPYRNKVRCEVDKNLVLQSASEIREQLPRRW